MTLPVETVRDFLNDSYQLVSASSPTVPLQGNDQSKGLAIMNRLLNSYAGTGLMLTIPKEINFPIILGQTNVTFTDASVTIPPTVNPNINQGRLANLQNAYLILDGVTYPLWDESRNTFKSSYKYDPLQGLPRFVIVTYYDDYTDMRIYPAPSQGFQLFVFGKFQLPNLGINDTMAELPTYYTRYLQFAVAKDLAMYKGRAEAWTDRLEEMYLDAKKDMESCSPVNLNIESEHESWLNGSWRVRSGI
jgi:hypothetical protein